MKLGPVPKIDKRNKKTSKNLTMKSCRKIVTSLPFSNLRPIWSNPKLIFSLMVPFILQKNESRNKKSLAKLSHYCFE